MQKSVFIAFYQGDQLKVRVKKICEGYHAALYPCPESAGLRRETSIGVYSRLQDLTTVLTQTNDHRHRVLVAAAKHLRSWIIKVRKIKVAPSNYFHLRLARLGSFLKLQGIYHTLNMFSVDVTSKALVAECWIPDADTDAVRTALKRGSVSFAIWNPMQKLFKRACLTDCNSKRANLLSRQFWTSCRPMRDRLRISARTNSRTVFKL